MTKYLSFLLVVISMLIAELFVYFFFTSKIFGVFKRDKGYFVVLSSFVNIVVYSFIFVIFRSFMKIETVYFWLFTEIVSILFSIIYIYVLLWLACKTSNNSHKFNPWNFKEMYSEISENLNKK